MTIDIRNKSYKIYLNDYLLYTPKNKGWYFVAGTGRTIEVYKGVFLAHVKLTKKALAKIDLNLLEKRDGLWGELYYYFTAKGLYDAFNGNVKEIGKAVKSASVALDQANDAIRGLQA